MFDVQTYKNKLYEEQEDAKSHAVLMIRYNPETAEMQELWRGNLSAGTAYIWDSGIDRYMCLSDHTKGVVTINDTCIMVGASSCV